MTRGRCLAAACLLSFGLRWPQIICSSWATAGAAALCCLISSQFPGIAQFSTHPVISSRQRLSVLLMWPLISIVLRQGDTSQWPFVHKSVTFHDKGKHVLKQYVMIICMNECGMYHEFLLLTISGMTKRLCVYVIRQLTSYINLVNTVKLAGMQSHTTKRCISDPRVRWASESGAHMHSHKNTRLFCDTEKRRHLRVAVRSGSLCSRHRMARCFNVICFCCWSGACSSTYS